MIVVNVVLGKKDDDNVLRFHMNYFSYFETNTSFLKQTPSNKRRTFEVK